MLNVAVANSKSDRLTRISQLMPDSSSTRCFRRWDDWGMEVYFGFLSKHKRIWDRVCCVVELCFIPIALWWTIIDEYAQEVLRVRYLNPGAISLRGNHIGLPPGMTNNCFMGSEKADFEIRLP